MKLFKLILIVTLFTNTSLFGETPSLNLISREQANSISEEFSSNFVHTTVSGASTLGQIFGVEVGIMAGVSKTPKLDEISRSTDPNATIEKIPHAGAFAIVSMPFGITGELSYVPEVGSDVKFNHLSFGLKYTLPQSLGLPVDIALRLHGSSSEFSYNEIVNNSSTGNTNVNTNIAFDTSSFGYQIVVSKKFLLFEPYAGLGAVSADTTISSTASSTNVSIFNFSSSDTYNAETSGTHFFLGSNLNLLIFKLGAEYAKVMDVSRYSMKLSFYF